MEFEKDLLMNKQLADITGNAVSGSVSDLNPTGTFLKVTQPTVLKFAGTDEDKAAEKLNYDNIIGTFAAMIEKYAGTFDFAGKAVRNGA